MEFLVVIVVQQAPEVVVLTLCDGLGEIIALRLLEHLAECEFSDFPQHGGNNFAESFKQLSALGALHVVFLGVDLALCIEDHNAQVHDDGIVAVSLLAVVAG